MTNTRSAPTFTVAPTPSLAAELLDNLVAFEPRGEDVIETKLGPSPAVIARVVAIGDDGTFTDRGEHPIFWSYIRRQLLVGKDEFQWVIGRFVKVGQAYCLDPLTDEEQATVVKVLKEVPSA